MAQDSLDPRLAAIIAEYFGVYPQEVTLEANLSGYSIDSLDLIEMINEIEEEFDISLEGLEDAGVSTVGDLAQAVEKANA